MSRRARGLGAHARQFGILEADVERRFVERCGARLAEEAFEATGGSNCELDVLSPRDRSFELVCFCEPALAYFAISRYIDFVDEPPLTENAKVREFVLRERGLTPTSWDEGRAGIRLRR